MLELSLSLSLVWGISLSLIQTRTQPQGFRRIFRSFFPLSHSLLQKNWIRNHFVRIDHLLRTIKFYYDRIKYFFWWHLMLISYELWIKSQAQLSTHRQYQWQYFRILRIWWVNISIGTEMLNVIKIQYHQRIDKRQINWHFESYRMYSTVPCCCWFHFFLSGVLRKIYRRNSWLTTIL